MLNCRKPLFSPQKKTREECLRQWCFGDLVALIKKKRTFFHVERSTLPKSIHKKELEI